MPSSANPDSRAAARLILALLSSAALIGLTASAIFLSGLTPGFLLIAWVAFAQILINSIRNLWKEGNAMRPTTWAPVLIQVFALLITLLTPFEAIMIHHDFNGGIQRREHIIGMINAGELKPMTGRTRTGFIKLPPQDRDLSIPDGKVAFRQEGSVKSVFFARQCTLFSCWGYLYRSDGGEPSGAIWSGDLIYSERMTTDWYRVRAKM